MNIVQASLPLYWRNETSGQLAPAVLAYLEDRTGGHRVPESDLCLVVEYLKQWVKAPCWEQHWLDVDDEYKASWRALQKDVDGLKTAEEVGAWLMRALDFGIDPL